MPYLKLGNSIECFNCKDLFIRENSNSKYCYSLKCIEDLRKKSLDKELTATKKCFVCSQEKSITLFGKVYNKNGRIDYQQKCHKCRSADITIKRKKLPLEEKHLARISKYYKNIKVRFGIDPFKYNLMLKEQKYCCAICNINLEEYRFNTNYTNFSVDHDHRTGKIRNLLCSNCNSLLGQCKEDLDILDKASKYIKYWKNKESNSAII